MSQLTNDQALALLNDLFTLPDRQPKAAAPKKAKSKTPTPPKGITPAHTPTGTATLRILEVVVQTCSTCGSEHEYIGRRHVRFETPRTAIECASASPTPIPSRIDHRHETTDICPTCIRIGAEVETYIALTDPAGLKSLIQQELFHG